MNVKDYCKIMETELVTWKSKIYDALRKLEELPEEERKRFSSQIKEFNRIIDDLEEKLERLKVECPSEWSSERKEIETKKKRLEEKWYEYWSQIRY